MEVKELLGKDFEIKKNKTIVKDLMKYGKSEEFKEILDYCQVKQKEIIDKNRKILKDREDIEFIGTYLNDNLRKIKVLEEIIEKVNNDNFKKYLKDRLEKYWSSIDHSVEKEVLFSTEIDLNKVEIAEYFAIKHYLAFAIDIYNKGDDKDYYDKNNPYE